MKYGKTYMYRQSFHEFATSSCESLVESDAQYPQYPRTFLKLIISWDPCMSHLFCLRAGFHC